MDNLLNFVSKSRWGKKNVVHSTKAYRFSSTWERANPVQSGMGMGMDMGIGMGMSWVWVWVWVWLWVWVWVTELGSFRSQSVYTIG